jgi:hypothetical protein
MLVAPNKPSKGSQNCIDGFGSGNPKMRIADIVIFAHVHQAHIGERRLRALHEKVAPTILTLHLGNEPYGRFSMLSSEKNVSGCILRLRLTAKLETSLEEKNYTTLSTTSTKVKATRF